MGIAIGWIVFSFVVGVVGTDRKIGFWGAFFVSILLSPLIGLIITLVSKNKEEEAYEKKVLSVQKSHLEELKKLSSTGKAATISVADELEKLRKLKDEKLISDEEFLSLKNKIINDQLTNTIDINTISDQKEQKENLSFPDLSDLEIEEATKFINYGIKPGEKLVINKQTRVIDRFDEKEWKKLVLDDLHDDWVILKEA